jgi:(p)ppGpp synthase/HD superfamily hydrolase
LLAEDIAREAHAGQTEERTGDSYIKHVERVVDLVEGDNAKAVAWLHDVIEDSPNTADDLIARGMPIRIVAAVALLTRHERTETYADYIQNIKDRKDPLAIAVKLADLKDHFRPNCPARLRPRYENAWKTLTGEAWSSRRK